MQIYRDLTMPGEYVKLQRFCSDFMVPQLCQFTEILLRFYGASSTSIYRDFAML